MRLGVDMRKLLTALFIFSILFIVKCEDESVSYINCESISFSSGLNWIAWVVEGASPPSGHINGRTSKWIHLYKDEKYVDTKNSSDGAIVTKDLEGENYTYVPK